MRNSQSGFTLIELVVVIVILGILAATAIPRFTALTEQANEAVAQGILGAFMSSAVIQLGVNQGNAASFTTIRNNTDIENATATIEVTAGGASTTECSTDPAVDSTITVTVEGQTATGTLSTALCSG